ncbi:MAG: hypothetical protein AAFY71_12170 [Bacteroidota bacterium]
MIPSYSRNEDQLYGPTEVNENSETSKESYYFSKPDHRNTAKKKKEKTRWEIKEGQEFHIFKIAEESNTEIPNSRWYCEKNKCLFSIHDNGKTILGKGSERLAKFPEPINTNDNWHGYPVKGKESQNLPSEKLLDVWKKEDVITETTKKRIETKRL